MFKSPVCANRVEGGAALAVAAAGDWLTLEVVLQDAYLNPIQDATELARAVCILLLEGPGTQQPTTLPLDQASPGQNRCHVCYSKYSSKRHSLVAIPADH